MKRKYFALRQSVRNLLFLENAGDGNLRRELLANLLLNKTFQGITFQGLSRETCLGKLKILKEIFEPFIFLEQLSAAILCNNFFCNIFF